MDDFSFSFPICMLGARGVGKSSMIAALVHEFDRVVNDPTLQLIPTAQSDRRLNELLSELKARAIGADDYFDAEKRNATIEREQYDLILNHTNSAAEMTISFIDYPGSWLVEDLHKSKVDEMVSKAAVILVAVDAPSLMEEDGVVPAVQNQPEAIAHALGRGLRGRQDQKRLVLFVMTRCEAWTQGTNDQRLKMRLRFGQCFEKALRVLKGYEGSTTVVYCPIQTLGKAQYSHFKGGRPIFHRLAQAYEPKDCDQPLRYSLAFITRVMQLRARASENIASKAYAERHTLECAWDGFWGIFGHTPPKLEQLEKWKARASSLLSAVDKFAQDCRTDIPFEIVQNKALLGL